MLKSNGEIAYELNNKIKKYEETLHKLTNLSIKEQQYLDVIYGAGEHKRLLEHFSKEIEKINFELQRLKHHA